MFIFKCHVMKTKNFKFRKYLALSILIFPLLLVSCEEDSFDARDQMLGFYDYKIEAYLDTGEELVYIGDQPGHYDVTGVAELRKNSDYDDMIDFWDGTDILFQGENIRENANTITFDIPLQEFWLGPIPVSIIGYNYWDVDDIPYHGAYLYGDESIEIGFAAEIMDVGSDLVMLFTAYRD